MHSAPFPPSPSPSAEVPRDLLLLFADISGYTGFIRDNPYDLAHATWIIHDLLEAVTAALAPAVRLAKLEGDAAFCAGDPAAVVALGSRLKAAVEAFQQRQAALAGANACACTACAGISRLDLKILLHRGDVVRFRAATGEELSGLPVIVLHRLAKNGVRRARYLLWTDALAELVTPLPGAVARRVERYDDIGAVPVSVVTDLPGPLPPKPTGLVLRWADTVRKMLLWLPLRLRRVPFPGG